MYRLDSEECLVSTYSMSSCTMMEGYAVMYMKYSVGSIGYDIYGKLDRIR